MLLCDWISIYQQHATGTCPDMVGGRLITLSAATDGTGRLHVGMIDEDTGEIFGELRGELSRSIGLSLPFQASYETKVHIRAVAGRVELSGNIGRLARPDNLFGYSVRDCLVLANLVLDKLGLPRFTLGNRLRGEVPLDCPWKADGIGRNGSAIGDDSFIRTGAVITRIDMTCNYATGSYANAGRVKHFLGGLPRHRKRAQEYPNGVTWGEGSRYWYAKVYVKYDDLVLSETTPPEVLAFAKEHGVIRDEISLKSMYLKRYNLDDPLRFFRDSELDSNIYTQFGAFYQDNSVMASEITDIPGRAGEVALMWREGVNMRNRFSKAQFYKHRAALLDYGIDIAVPCNITRLTQKVSVIEVQPLAVPDWYQLPSLREAAIRIAA